MRKSIFALAVLSLFGGSPQMLGQRGNQQGNPSSGSPPTAASLQGLSFDQLDWPGQLKLPPLAQKNRAVACYTLAYGETPAQPFVLLPVRPNANPNTPPDDQPESWRHFYLNCNQQEDPQAKRWCKSHPDSSWTPCSVIDDKHPVKMGQTLVIGIDASDVNLSRLQILNINVTTQQGTPINATPVRVSFSNSGTGVTNSSAFALDGGHPTVYFLTWPNVMPGDTIPTVSINGIYDAPVPGERWSANTFYPVGSVVTSATLNRHYYVALQGGISDDSEPLFSTSSTVPTVADGQILWLDSGVPQSPGGGGNPGAGAKPLQNWRPHQSFQQGDTILDPYNGHVFVSLSAPIMTGGTATPPQSGSLSPDPFSLPSFVPPNVVQPAQPPQQVQEGSESWQAQPPGTACTTAWAPRHHYTTADPAVGPYNGLCYKALKDADSGDPPVQPYFPAFGGSTVTDNEVLWSDAGTTAPSSVTGGPAADQTVSLLNLQFPQVHTLSFYNLAAGVVYSWVRNPGFGIPVAAKTSSDQVRTGSNPIVDPVLFLTAYPWPIDAESRCGFKCIYKTAPGISVGISLASPASNYYVGGSFELLRNMQVVSGYGWQKINKLPNPPVAIPTNATSAVTVQTFSGGPFVGITYNILGFVQSLFGGGGGGAGGGGSKGTPSQ